MTKLVLDSLMITGFVAGMMLLIEYLNVGTSGKWSRALARRGFRQYLVAALLGVMPGCLGAFTVVALYSHGVLSFGAVVAAMAAASGDEAFVMLALIPKTAVVLAAALFVLGVLAGFLADLVSQKRLVFWPSCQALVVHQEERLPWLSAGEVLNLWRDCSAARGILSSALGLFAAALAAGVIGPPSWSWVRVTLLGVSAAALAALIPESGVRTSPGLRHTLCPAGTSVWSVAGKFHRAGRPRNAAHARSFAACLRRCQSRQFPPGIDRGSCLHAPWILTLFIERTH
jgi:hypothetical protein